jgi:hypothetical protein
VTESMAGAHRVLRSPPMTKALLGLTLLALAGCGTTTNIKAVPLKQQSLPEIDADRKRCDEWAKKTAAPRTGFAACMVAAGYEVEPEVGSISQPIRLARPSTPPDPTRVLLEALDCDAQARREAERDLGRISIWIRENLNWHWKVNTEKRRQVFVDCLKPRGYEIAKS